MNGDDQARLERMRDRFLAGCAGEDYWRDDVDLELYDRFFAARIGWKWDAVLAQVERRVTFGEIDRVIDWGCGSGIATRRFCTRRSPRMVRFLDRSRRARDFAAKRLAEERPGITIEAHDAPIGEACDLLLVSHVLSELTPRGIADLEMVARRARHVIWVESATHETSRALAAIRDRWCAERPIILPCTHDHPCPLFTAGNERHWCHNFAKPPSSVFQEADWAEFARRLEIDLRALPYSFLAAGPIGEGHVERSGHSVRVLGRPRFTKVGIEFYSCGPDGIEDLRIRKRERAAFETFEALGENEHILDVDVREGEVRDLRTE